MNVKEVGPSARIQGPLPGLLAVVLLHACVQARHVREEVGEWPSVLVLDDCDPEYEGGGPFGDGLRACSTGGDVLWSRTGLNGCDTIGVPRAIAVDHERGRIWFSQNVARTVTAVDPRGREVARFDVSAEPAALAVDPRTGHVWCLVGEGIGEGTTEVFSAAGEHVLSVPVSGFDIAYDGVVDSFWIADAELARVTRDGEVLVRREVAGWTIRSLAPDRVAGGVWVVEGAHSQAGGRRRLAHFDRDGTQTRELPLSDPLGVDCDPRSGLAWVSTADGIVRVPVTGEPLPALPLPGARGIAISPTSPTVWVATDEEVLRLTPDGVVAARVRLPGRSGQTWLASP